MSDSIAKLSVIITGDSSPLGRATQQGAQYVRTFEAQTGGSMIAVSNHAKAMNAAFSVASGNLTKLSGLATFGWVGLIAIAAAAAGKLAFNLAAASDALEVAAGGNVLDTWAGQWDRVQAAALSIAQTLGRPISEALTNEARGLANVLERIANDIMPEYIRRERELAATAKERAKAAEEAAKAEKKRVEEMLAAQERMRASAERITSSLRRPGEIYADTISELNNLFNRGFLNVETLSRGIAKARADLISATQTIEAKSRTSAPTVPINAADRFSSSGQSAIEAARRQNQAQLEIEKQQLASDRRREALIEETNRVLRKGLTGGVTLATAGLQ